jgi:hypothetical protein
MGPLGRSGKASTPVERSTAEAMEAREKRIVERCSGSDVSEGIEKKDDWRWPEPRVWRKRTGREIFILGYLVGWGRFPAWPRVGLSQQD